MCIAKASSVVIVFCCVVDFLCFLLIDCFTFVHILLLKQEFLCAIDVTSAGTPNEKLQWAFRMYDVDGNGSIDLQVTIMRTSLGSRVFYGSTGGC